MVGARAVPHSGAMDAAATKPEPVGLFLVGLNEGFARALARYVKGDPRLVLAGVAPSLALASLLLPGAEPDVALLDWAELNGAARETVQGLRRGRPALRIVCVVSDTEAYRDAALKADADAAISKNGFAEEIGPLLRGFFPERHA